MKTNAKADIKIQKEEEKVEKIKKTEKETSSMIARFGDEQAKLFVGTIWIDKTFATPNWGAS